MGLNPRLRGCPRLLSTKRAGTYLPGYEAYGELLQRIGEVSHASCLLLTSREKPAEVAALEGETLPVRSQVLSGLDLIAAKTILSTKGLSGHPADVEFSPDGQRLASSAEDQTIRLWLVKTGQCLRVLQGYNNRIRAMAISSTGLLACATNDQITLRNLVVEHSVTQLKRHIGEVYSVAFTPDGNWLASGGNDGIVKIWDVNTAHCLQSFRAHRGRIFKVLFHPTQPLLISAGSDGTTRIWDIATFRCLHTLTGHGGPTPPELAHRSTAPD